LTYVEKKIKLLFDEGNKRDATNTATKTATTEELQYLLAHTILELAYHSTDTIERGKTIYQRALLEYHKLLRLDPFYIGACESLVLLLAFLGYDDHCMGLIQFMLHPPGYCEEGDDGNGTTTREEAICNYNLSHSQQDCDVWIYDVSTDRTAISLSFDECNMIRDRIPKQWCPNLFLVPLLLIKMRQRSRLLVQSDSHELRQEILNLARQVEYEANFSLPVLRSLFPDSRQRWGTEEVSALLACGDYYKLSGNEVNEDNFEDDNFDENPYQPNIWEQHCLTFWMMLKDCYALAPGMLDVVEETINAMQLMGKPAIPEDDPDTPTAAEYMEFVDQMAKQQRHENEYY